MTLPRPRTKGNLDRNREVILDKVYSRSFGVRYLDQLGYLSTWVLFLRALFALSQAWRLTFLCTLLSSLVCRTCLARTRLFCSQPMRMLVLMPCTFREGATSRPSQPIARRRHSLLGVQTSDHRGSNVSKSARVLGGVPRLPPACFVVGEMPIRTIFKCFTYNE